jgi:CheY-like chemotaxis protein
MAPRVFVVEDDALLQRVVRRGLKERGYVPVAARCGAELRVLLELGEPDLIVLDIELPDADGRDILHLLRQNPATADIPVIVWSGRNLLHDEASAIKLGAQAYVAKAEVSNLVHAIDAAFSEAALRDSRRVDGAAAP